MEAVIGVDEGVTFPAAEIHAVPVVSVKREPGNRQRLALGAGLLDPVIAPA